jgi:hypothetical protein
MAKRKRTEAEIARDRDALERMMHEGRIVPEMFAAINAQYAEVRDARTGAVVTPSRQITRQAFQKDVQLVQERLVERADNDKNAERGRELRRLFALEMLAMKGWDASWGVEETSTTEIYASVTELRIAQIQGRDPVMDKQKTVVKRKKLAGDVSWISEMRKLSRERRDLLGLDLTKPTNRPPPDEQEQMEPAEAGALLMGLLGKALDRFDEAVKTGALPKGLPVPRALLPEGFEPPPGMEVSEAFGVIDVEAESVTDAGPDEDAIVATLEAEAGRGGGGAP